MNASFAIFVTLLGMVMEVSPSQEENAPLSILVIPLDMVTEVSPVQRLKASSPILVTLIRSYYMKLLTE